MQEEGEFHPVERIIRNWERGGSLRKKKKTISRLNNFVREKKSREGGGAPAKEKESPNHLQMRKKSKRVKPEAERGEKRMGFKRRAGRGNFVIGKETVMRRGGGSDLREKNRDGR